MRFRWYSLVAVVGAILLLSTLVFSQQRATVPDQTKPAAGQEEQPAAPGNTPETPVEPVLSGPYPVMSQAAEDRARQIFQMFNKVEASQMWASLSEGLRKRSGTEAKFVEVNKKLREKMGLETAMLEENIVPYVFAPDTTYARLSTFANVRVPVISVITINQRGQIDSFVINRLPPVAEGRYAGYKDVTKLKLPFSGEWLVYQGGRNIFENAYAQSDDFRFAIDFVYLKDKRLFSGAGGIGSKNEDYYCFGQPILAPADGTVVKAEAGYDDNPPGKPTGDPADGNIVVVSHGNGESSMFDHLKQNSLKVKRGDKVKQGDVLAECGNSGGGPAPHLHYQLQRGAGTLLPAQFNDYIADGKPVASGEPKRGEFVQNAATTAASDAATGKAAPATGKAAPATSKPAPDTTTAEAPPK